MRKMVSLALSREERDKNSPMMLGYGGRDDDGPAYPPGCCIYLDDSTLKKLDLDAADVERGDTLHAFILAKVERISDGPEGQCIHMQITDMGIEDEDRENEAAERDEPNRRAKKRYGADEDEGEKEDA